MPKDNGFSALFHVLKKMGLFEQEETGASSWNEVLEELRAKRGFEDLRSFIKYCSNGDKDLAARTSGALEWLQMKSDLPVSDPSSVVKSFCDVLEQNLQFAEGERDMVLMHHDIKASFSNGSAEHHTCQLQVFGDGKMTAMCKTVGYTAAIGTKLILDGDISDKGLLLPTSKSVYVPSLDLLSKEGLVFEEHVRHDNDLDEAV